MQRLERRAVALTPWKAQSGESPARAWLARGAVIAVFAAASALLTLVFWPGTLDGDTVAELNEAATGHYSDWHTPILDALWRVLYLMGIRGPGWILPVDLFTLLIGFYLVSRIRYSRLVSTIVALACCVFPPVLSWAIHIGVDAWFAATIIVAFGFAARATRTTGTGRTLSLAAAVWFAFLAMAARHNAFPAVLLLFIAMAAITLGPGVRHKRLIACGVGVLATVALLAVQIGIQHSLGTKSTHPEQSTYIYDLSHLSLQEHRVLLPPSVDPGQSLAVIRKNTSVITIDPMTFGKGAPIKFPVEGTRFQQLEKAWKSALTHDPSGYLWERGRLLGWTLSIGHPSTQIFLLASGNPKYPPKFPAASQDGYWYLSALGHGPNGTVGDWLYDGWIYALILLAGAVALVRRTQAEQVIAAMGIGMPLYTLVLAFSGPGVVYRYIYPMVATATAMAAILVPLLVGFLAQVFGGWRSSATPQHRVGRIDTGSTL